MDGLLGQIGAASVKLIFPISGRGHALVLADLDGVVPSNGRVWNGMVSAFYRGPEIADTSAGEAFVTILLDEAGYEAVGAAERVTFTA